MNYRKWGWYLLLLCQFCVSQTSARPRSAESSKPQLYRNQAAGFCYAVPFGWVDRTEDIGAASDHAEGDAIKPSSKVLLAVFERPPQAPLGELNAAVVIASESISAYQGLKTAADYFGPLAEVTSAHGLQMEGGPYDVVINGRHLARGDFTKNTAATAIHQSTLVVLDKGSILSFTFIAEDQAHIDNLIANLRFGPCGKA